MQTAAACTGTGNAPTYTHQAGDKFVFKGGVTWPVGCFQMFAQKGGTSTTQDYYGVDKTWFTGGSWTRPIFDMQGQTPSGGRVITAGSFFAGGEYITFDNFEIKNQLVALSGSATFNWAIFVAALPGQGSTSACGATGQCASLGIIVSNCYIHGWTANLFTDAENSNTVGSIAGAFLVDHTEINGDDATVAGVPATSSNWFGIATYGCKTVSNSKLHGGWDGIEGGSDVIHDNEFYHFAQNVPGAVFHTQVIEDNRTGNGAGMLIYNNLVHDVAAGVCLYINYNSIVFNNVIYNNKNNVAILTGPGGATGSPLDSPSNVGYFYNNTVDNTAEVHGQDCISWNPGSSYRGLGAITYQNNICLDNNGNDGSGGSSFNIATVHYSNNRPMTATEASTYGFTIANKYAPASSDPYITGKGVNPMPSIVSQPVSILSPLSNDAQGAPWFGGTYVPRGSAWDLGAFVAAPQTASSQPSKPAPPTGLSVSVQ